jgi:hypothetical protein
MKLSEYFERTEGMGVLATADSEGKVDLAIYARPHVMDDPHAAYMFVEKGEGYSGRRLYLKKIREETDAELIDKLRRRPGRSYAKDNSSKAHLVTFSISRIRPLDGDASE